jgi:hypothetical protein
MRKVTINSEEIMEMTREYLKEKGFDLTNGELTMSVATDGSKITHYEIIATLPHEKPDLKVINGKMPM